MACCHVMSIDEIDKPFKTDCPNQCNGCAIYPDRPISCVEFECLWLQGWAGHERHRPSDCGVMYTGFRDQIGEIISAWELWPNAFEEGDNSEMLKEVSKIDVITLRHFDGRISFRGRTAELRKFLIERGYNPIK